VWGHCSGEALSLDAFFCAVTFAQLHVTLLRPPKAQKQRQTWGVPVAQAVVGSLFTAHLAVEPGTTRQLLHCADLLNVRTLRVALSTLNCPI